MPKRKSSFRKATKLLTIYSKKSRKTFKKLKLGKKLTPERKRLFLGFSLLLLGFILLNQYQSIQNAKKQTVVNKTNTTSKEPIKASNQLDVPINTKDPLVRLLVPSSKVDVGIVEAKIVGGYWEVSENSASHGVGSAYPGMKGNTVIFAHARAGLFLNLRQAKVGEEILVFSKNKWFKYKIETVKEVLPNQVEVVSPTKDERLTLFTCSGFADEKRLIVVAKPSK